MDRMDPNSAKLPAQPPARNNTNQYQVVDQMQLFRELACTQARSTGCPAADGRVHAP
jgi:hypothetical protein